MPKPADESEVTRPAQRRFSRPRLAPDKKTGRVKAVFKQHPYTNQTFHELPPPQGRFPYHLSLEEVLPEEEMQRIVESGSLTVHITGDTGGVSNPVPQQLVADAMERDFDNPSGDRPSFLYILGDVIYYYGEAANYYPQFYEPYLHYPAPIFAIPGNHDGDLPIPPPEGVTSLKAFVNNFCAEEPSVTPDAGPVDRDAMTQPNVYWTLATPFSTMVGLYSNVPEGGVLKSDQLEWLSSELADAPEEKAFVLSVHHPSYSADTAHGGSAYMLSTLDRVFEKADRYPDMILSGHVHNYQRYTRRLEGRELPYIVAGGGGYFNLYSLQNNPDGSPLEVPVEVAERGVTLESYCTDRHGYLKMRFEKNKILGQYFAVNEANQPNPGQANRIDSFAVDIKEHRLVSSVHRPA